jgi:hypothetical protein
MIVKYSSVGPIDFGGLRILDYTSKLDVRSSMVANDFTEGESWSLVFCADYIVIAILSQNNHQRVFYQ